MFHLGAMVRRQLHETQWTRIEAVLSWRRPGVPWRDLPDELGPWKTVFNRFDRWSKTGKWTRIFHALQTERDDEWHCLDSTIARSSARRWRKRGAAAHGILRVFFSGTGAGT